MQMRTNDPLFAKNTISYRQTSCSDRSTASALRDPWGPHLLLANYCAMPRSWTHPQSLSLQKAWEASSSRESGMIPLPERTSKADAGMGQMQMPRRRPASLLANRAQSVWKMTFLQQRHKKPRFADVCGDFAVIAEVSRENLPSLCQCSLSCNFCRNFFRLLHSFRGGANNRCKETVMATARRARWQVELARTSIITCMLLSLVF